MEYEDRKFGHLKRMRLTDHEYACRATGFTPIHCAVANGRIRMYDLLSGAHNHFAPQPGESRLANHQVVNGDQISAHSTHETWSGLTPLQLAAKLGDHRMCKHILRKRLFLNWKWGPLTSYRISLDEIDSAHEGGNDVMELVGDFRASESTQSLVLDDFMQGFLFTLIKEKWVRWTWFLFYCLRLLELTYLALVISLSFLMKFEPSTRSLGMAVVILVLSLLLVGIEVYEITLWWRNDEIRTFMSAAAFRAKMRGLFLWMDAFSTKVPHGRHGTAAAPRPRHVRVTSI